jgi:tetratricopeptide (TPR) repeat protein
MEITNVVFDNSQFNLVSSLPFVKDEGKAGFVLSMTLSNPVTNLYKLNYQVHYKVNGIAKVYSDSLKVAVIVESNTELSIVGKRAIQAYNSAGDTAQISRISNQGVIYRLLGYPNLAKACFNNAITMALPQRFGYTGIKMNQGVAESDLNKGTDATAIYDKAYSDVSGSMDVSILAPQITYNKAWELYNKGDCTGAEPLANQTLNHAKANEWLKAKASVLLGAIKHCKGDLPGALQSFQMAYSLDMNGPVGALARENMDLLNPANSIESAEGVLIYPQPAVDYFVIEYRGTTGKEINLELTDMTGKILYTQKIMPSGNTLLHPVEVKGFSPGVYLLTLTGEGKKEIRKVLVR